MSKKKKKISSLNISSFWSRVTQSILLSSFFFGFIGLFFLAFLGTFVYPPLFDSTSVYNVTAEVERITVKSYDNPKADWYLSNVKIDFPDIDNNSGTCPKDEESNSLPDEFSGSLQLGNNIQIVFTRIGLAKLEIQLFPLPVSTNDSQKNVSEDLDVIGDLYDQHEEYLCTIRRAAIITIANIEDRLTRGESLFFNISGEIHLADTKDYPDSELKPLLKTGTVSILEREFILGPMFGYSYLIGPYQLELGDSLELVQENEIEKKYAEGFVVGGLVIGDSMQGLTTAYSVEANKGIISRYKFDGYEIAATSWNRLFHDQILGYIWMLFAFALSIFLFLWEISIEEEE